MARVTVEDCLKKIDDMFALVHVSSARVKQLKEGASLKVEGNNKDVVMSLREIASGKVAFEDMKVLDKESVDETLLLEEE